MMISPFTGDHEKETFNNIEKCESFTSIMKRKVDFTTDDILLHIPVTTNTENVTYANVYCALCHGVHEYWFWNIEVICM